MTDHLITHHAGRQRSGCGLRGGVENGQAVVTGITYSTDFSSSIYYGAGDAFVTRLSSSGEPAFIQLLGGRGVDAGFDIAVQNGDIWVAGQTFSFNVPARGLKGLQDGFVMRLNADGSTKWASLVGVAARIRPGAAWLKMACLCHRADPFTDFRPRRFTSSDTYLAVYPRRQLESACELVGRGGVGAYGRLEVPAGILCGMTSQPICR